MTKEQTENKKEKKKMSPEKKKKLKIGFGIAIGLTVLMIGISFIPYYVGSDKGFEIVDNIVVSPLGDDSPSFTQNADTGHFEMVKEDGRDFRVLQLTDPHISGSIFKAKNDEKAYLSMFKTIKEADPDLIVLTGDVVYGFALHSGSLNNEKSMKQVASFFEKIQIPWTMTIGNHDNELATIWDREDVSKYLESDDLKYCMYAENSKGYEDLSGYGNNFINIYDTMGNHINSLVLFDSHSTVGMFGYDKIYDDQVEWYSDTITNLAGIEGKTTAELRSLAFFHVPLEEYKTAWDLHENGSDEVEYLYGRCDENILCYKTSKKNPKGKFFDTAVELGSTDATFVGHNHKNNFAIVYKGIQLTFGNSTVYTGLNGIANDETYRGGTLITIDENGEFESTNMFLRDYD